MLKVMEITSSDDSFPSSFIQTDPQDATETEPAAVMVALGSAEHAAKLAVECKSGIMVAHASQADEPQAHVPFVGKHSMAASSMAHALREQAGFWLEVFCKGAPLAYNRFEVERAVTEQCHNVKALACRQLVGLVTSAGKSMKELAGLKPKFVLKLDAPRGLAAVTFPTAFALPEGFSPGFRVHGYGRRSLAGGRERRTKA